ncbi:cation-transporting P-type ATPase [Streptomyces sp. NBC_00829]|uniref:cation-transporting P-type ATPase n=1 Tax=Streptomyces sp. NBC_00829 TaxID=2903679 RepID=UPI003864A270|nr:cation-translocating P-type ATPase [Streptomyces sp. NBC_00829]
MNQRRGSRRPDADVDELRSTAPAAAGLSGGEAARRLELYGPNELQAAGVYLPPLQDLLGTEPLPPTDFAVACVLSGLGHVVMRLQARLRRSTHRAAAQRKPGDVEALACGRETKNPHWLKKLQSGRARRPGLSSSRIARL